MFRLEWVLYEDWVSSCRLNRKVNAAQKIKWRKIVKWKRDKKSIDLGKCRRWKSNRCSFVVGSNSKKERRKNHNPKIDESFFPLFLCSRAQKVESYKRKSHIFFVFVQKKLIEKHIEWTKSSTTISFLVGFYFAIVVSSSFGFHCRCNMM